MIIKVAAAPGTVCDPDTDGVIQVEAAPSPPQEVLAALTAIEKE